MFSTAARLKGASGVLQITGQTHFCCNRGMTYVALTLCFKLRNFFTLIAYKDAANRARLGRVGGQVRGSDAAWSARVRQRGGTVR